MKKEHHEINVELRPTGGGDPHTLTIGFDGPAGGKKRATELFAITFLRFLPAEFAEKYEWAYYDDLRHSEEGRRAMDFLRKWKWNMASAKADGQTLKGRIFLTTLEPLLDALKKGNAAFFSGLSKAMRILQQQERRSSLHKWLFDYAMENCWENKHTPAQLNEEFVSKFHKMTNKKLHEKLHQLGIPHKDEPRGKASPNYNAFLNLPPKRRQAG